MQSGSEGIKSRFIIDGLVTDSPKRLAALLPKVIPTLAECAMSARTEVSIAEPKAK